MIRVRRQHDNISEELSDEDFRKHYRMDRETFNYILNRIKDKLKKKERMARNFGRTDAAMTPKQMLGTLLKHLGGSSQHDNDFHYQFHRTTVQKALYRTMRILVEEFPINDFPFTDTTKLKKMANEWKMKSAGGLFDNCVGAFDGYLLSISKSCVNKKKVSNPQKYYCRKGFYSINVQVCCDADRRVTWMSLSHPGACPDVIAYKQSIMCRAVESGLLPEQFYFIGDNAYPSSSQMLTPFNRSGLKTDTLKRDSYNFYLSQLRINIECVFGILVNRFPILQQELKCRLLENAILTFRTCVCLHNLLVDRRIMSFNGDKDKTRLVQVPKSQRVQVQFHEVPEVDESNVIDCTSVNQTQTNITEVDETVGISDRRNEYVQKIYKAGYVRPKVTKWQRLSLQLPTL